MKELLDKEIRVTKPEYTMTEFADLLGVSKMQAKRFKDRYRIQEYRKGYDRRVRVLKAPDILNALEEMRGEWPV